MKSKKGGKYEKEVCKHLSLWWTDGNRDDIFYSTHGSGNRATIRAKQGLCTENMCGDVCASAEIGFAFTDYFMTEIKRGYTDKLSFIELVDKPDKKTLKIKNWVRKAERQRKENFRRGLLVIIKRDYANPFCIIDTNSFFRLCSYSMTALGDKYLEFSIDRRKYFAITFSAFLKFLNPGDIREIKKEFKIKRVKRRKNVHQKANNKKL